MTPEQKTSAKLIIAKDLKSEIEAMQIKGLPNEIIALEIYVNFINARVRILELEDEVIHLNNILDVEIKDLLKK